MLFFRPIELEEKMSTEPNTTSKPDDTLTVISGVLVYIGFAIFVAGTLFLIYLDITKGVHH